MCVNPALSNDGVATALYRLALALERGEDVRDPAACLADALRPDEPAARAQRLRRRHRELSLTDYRFLRTN